MSTRSARRELRRQLGVPVVPPGRLTRVAIAARRGLARGHRSSAPPQIRILEGLMSILDNRVLGLLVELEVATHTARPTEVAVIARACGCDPERLDRVLRYAVGRGYLGRDRRGRYVSNAVTARLVVDTPDSWVGWVRFAGSPLVWDSIRQLDAALGAEGGSGTEAVTGTDFFTHVNREAPEVGTAFNQAMESGARVQALALAVVLDWSDIGSVCDVGGGTGAALTVLLAHHPHLKTILLELPEVIAEARPAVENTVASGRLELVAGDFFEEVPAGADRYLLLVVLHDWSDEEAARILRRVAKAGGQGAEIVVVESVLPDRPVDDFALTTDLLMLTLASGRERTTDDFNVLFRAGGVRLLQSRVLPTGFTAFVLTPS